MYKLLWRERPARCVDCGLVMVTGNLRRHRVKYCRVLVHGDTWEEAQKYHEEEFVRFHYLKRKGLGVNGEV